MSLGAESSSSESSELDSESSPNSDKLLEQDARSPDSETCSRKSELFRLVDWNRLQVHFSLACFSSAPVISQNSPPSLARLNPRRLGDRDIVACRSVISDSNSLFDKAGESEDRSLSRVLVMSVKGRKSLETILFKK
jgi:hypothetical protein